MKKHIISIQKVFKQLIVVLIAGFMICSVGAQSHQLLKDLDITMTYAFNNPLLETVDIAGIVYDRVTLTDCYSAGNAGEPKIPSKGIFLLLPAKATVQEIQVTTGLKVDLGAGFLIEPTSQAIPLSQIQDVPIPSPNDAIYQTNAAYPGRLFTEVGVQCFRGYQILVLLLHPIQYNPVTGELFYYDSLNVCVKTVKTDAESTLYRGLPLDDTEVQRKVDNPEMTLSYFNEYSALSASFESYDLLIITTDSLKSGFEPLKDAHDATGVSTVIRTLTDIGASDLESIRNYIRDAYTDWGVEYVLIGGDKNIVPAAMLWVSGMDENVSYYEETMPSDVYYACLDGPYNYDGDGKWGEPTDGEGGDDVDLIAEVYVGRACVGTASEVTNFVTKTVAYINKDLSNPFFKDALFAAEYLGDYGIASYGSSYMNQLIDSSSDDGYTTVGIPTDVYNIDTLYDSPGYDWPPSAIISDINDGFHIINHLGHASYDYNLKLDTYDVDSLNNPSNRTCFIYSQGCMAGGFDDPYGYDCIAEHFTIKTTHAAFAGIWNARYGFFWSDSTDGDSQRFHREFWDAIFGEEIPQIGKANHDSKEDNLPIISRSCIRWVYYETNLFGDPALVITEETNHPPEKPTVPLGPTEGSIDLEYVFTSSTIDVDSDELYYQWDWESEISDWLGPYPSSQLVEATHKWMVPGEYVVKVKAKDSKGSESEWSDTAIINISKDKPQIEIGTLSGGLRIAADIKNTGSINATEVNWIITLQGLVLFGEQTSGTIQRITPDDSIKITTGFIIGLGPVTITVTAADAEKSVKAFLLGPFILNIR